MHSDKTKSITCAGIASALLLASRLASAAPELLRDLDTRPVPAGSSAFLLGVTGSVALFGASSEENGPTRLWRSDGTEAGTVLSDAPVPVAAPVSPVSTELVSVGSRVVYIGAAPGSSPGAGALYATDGTAAGTVALAAGTDFTQVSFAGRLANGTTFFNVSRSDGSRATWVTDGTPAQTRALPVGRVDPDRGRSLTVGNRLYFIAADNSTGFELWRSDGTVAGTRIVSDVLPGPDTSDPSILGVVGTNVYWAARSTPFLPEIWRTSTVTDAVVRFSALTPGNGLDQPGVVPVTGGLVFVGNDDLWFSDGTPGSAVRVRDFDAGAPDGVSLLGSVNGRAIFNASTPAARGGTWTTDGSFGGTVLLRDNGAGVQPGAYSLVAELPGRVLLGDADLWLSDGTPSGTVAVVSNPVATITAPSVAVIWPVGGSTLWRIDPASGAARRYIVDLTPPDLDAARRIGERFFFDATSPTAGDEPAVFDAQGARILRDIVPQVRNQSSSPAQFLRVGADAYFVTVDGTLWRSDGTDTGTRALTRPGIDYLGVTLLRAAAGRVYFVANDGVHGAEPWVSDGTSAGTRMLRDVTPGPGGSDVGADSASACRSWIVESNGLAYFGTRSAQLWVTDGTEAGTRRIESPSLATMVEKPTCLQPANGLVYFNAVHTGTRKAIHRTDGTSQGTIELLTIGTGSAVRPPTRFATLANELFLATQDADSTIWRSDGTPAGTRQVVAGGNPGAVTRISNLLGSLGGRLVIARSDTSGSGIFTWDGSSATPQRLGAACGETSGPGVVTAGQLFFRGPDALCVTDGTTTGTRVVASPLGLLGDALEPGTFDVGNGVVFFPGARALPGALEIWKSDGTPEGTFAIAASLTIGSASPALAGDWVLFGAADSRGDMELWSVRSARPRATDDTATATTGTAATIAVLANDTDADGRIRPNTLRITQAPGSGSAVVVAGAISYMPAAGFTGTTTLQYVVADDFGLESPPATLSITVSAPAPAPTPTPTPPAGGGGGGGGGGGRTDTLLLCLLGSLLVARRLRSRAR